MVLPYLKLPFELRSLKLLLRSYRQPLTNQALSTRHNGLLDQAAVIKVSLGADSSSLKVAGLLTVVRNTASAQLFVWITQWSASILSTELYINFSKYIDELPVAKSLKNILKFTYFNIHSRNTFFNRKRWLKKVLREWMFCFSTGSHKVVLDESILHYLCVTKNSFNFVENYLFLC